jgi:AcrR family transcriptional regulator
MTSKSAPGDKRSALLQAALELFAENGFNGSPTSLIAKRAGVANGTLFLYFKNKEELIRELFREVRAQIDGVILDSPAEMPVRERFLQSFDRLLRFFLANPQEFKFVEQYHFSPFCDLHCSTKTGENENLRNPVSYTHLTLPTTPYV